MLFFKEGEDIHIHSECKFIKSKRKAIFSSLGKVKFEVRCRKEWIIPSFFIILNLDTT